MAHGVIRSLQMYVESIKKTIILLENIIYEKKNLYKNFTQWIALKPEKGTDSCLK